MAHLAQNRLKNRNTHQTKIRMKKSSLEISSKEFDRTFSTKIASPNICLGKGQSEPRWHLIILPARG